MRIIPHVCKQSVKLALVLGASKLCKFPFELVTGKGWSFVILLKRTHLLLNRSIWITYHVLTTMAGIRLHTILAYLCLMSRFVILHLLQQLVSRFFAYVVNNFIWLHLLI